MSTLRIRDFTRGSVGNRRSGKLLRLAIETALEKEQIVVLDFSGIVGVTQSFLDEAIGVFVRREGPHVVNHLEFRSCADEIKEMLEFVVRYSEDVPQLTSIVFDLPLGLVESEPNVAHQVQINLHTARDAEGSVVLRRDISPEIQAGEGWIPLENKLQDATRSIQGTPTL